MLIWKSKAFNNRIADLLINLSGACFSFIALISFTSDIYLKLLNLTFNCFLSIIYFILAYYFKNISYEY